MSRGNILKRSSEAESCVNPKKSKIALEEDTKCNSSKMCETLGGDDQFSKDLLKEEMKVAKDKVTDVDVECSSEKKIKKVPVAKKKTSGYAKRPSFEQQNTNCNVNDRVVENTSCDRVENTSCEVSDEDHSDYDDVTMGGDDFHYSDNSDSESTTLQEKESDKENADLPKSVESKTDKETVTRTSSERVITPESSAEKKKVKKGPTLGDDSISEGSSGLKMKLNSGMSNDIEKPKLKSLKKKRTADTCSNSSSEIKKMRATDKSSDCGEKVLSNKENEDNLLKEFRSNLDSVIDDVVAKAKEDAMSEELYIDERAHIKEAVKRICDKIPEMTRYDMEKYISVKFVEHIAHRAAIGQLRERVQLVESTCDALKKKSSCIEKQNRDFDMVSKKFYNDIKLKRYPNNLTLPSPAKITRSVGLQVHFTSPYVRPGFPGHRSSSTSNFPVTELLVRTIPSSGSSSSPGQETALPSSQTPPTDQSAAAKKQKSTHTHTLGVPSQNKTHSKLTPSSSKPNLHKASPPQKQNVPPKTQPSKPGAPTMKPAGQAKPTSQIKPSPLSSKQIPSVVKTSTPSKQLIKAASTPSPVRSTSVSANGNPQRRESKSAFDAGESGDDQYQVICSEVSLSSSSNRQRGRSRPKNVKDQPFTESIHEDIFGKYWYYSLPSNSENGGHCMGVSDISQENRDGFSCPEKITHTSVKKHVCNYCGMSFPYKYNMSSHVCTHNSDKVHRWKKRDRSDLNTDGESYEVNRKFQQHLKTKESVKIALRKYFCKVCRKCYSTKKKCQKHIEEHKKRIEKYRRKIFYCEVCQANFPDKFILHEHLLTHNSGTAICLYCYNPFTFNFVHREGMEMEIFSNYSHYFCDGCQKHTNDQLY